MNRNFSLTSISGLVTLLLLLASTVYAQAPPVQAPPVQEPSSDAEIQAVLFGGIPMGPGGQDLQATRAVCAPWV